MKAVIVEIRGNRAAALLEDGQFVSIPDNAYAIGQEITLLKRESTKRTTQSAFRRRIAAVAASAIFVLAAGSGGIAYALPYGTVSIDVNPSIEYTINCFDRVLRVSGINEDGKAVLDGIDKNKLLNRKIDLAVAETITQLEAEGYLDEEEDAIVFSSGTGDRKHSASLAESLKKKFSSHAEVYSVAVTREEIASAHQKGTTAGKMKLLGDLEQEAPDNFREKDWIDKPVNDLMHAFQNGGKPDGEPAGDSAPAEHDFWGDEHPYESSASNSMLPPEEDKRVASSSMDRERKSEDAPGFPPQMAPTEKAFHGTEAEHPAFPNERGTHP